MKLRFNESNSTGVRPGTFKRKSDTQENRDRKRAVDYRKQEGVVTRSRSNIEEARGGDEHFDSHLNMHSFTSIHADNLNLEQSPPLMNGAHVRHKQYIIHIPGWHIPMM